MHFDTLRSKFLNVGCLWCCSGLTGRPYSLSSDTPSARLDSHVEAQYQHRSELTTSVARARYAIGNRMKLWDTNRPASEQRKAMISATSWQFACSLFTNSE